MFNHLSGITSLVLRKEEGMGFRDFLAELRYLGATIGNHFHSPSQAPGSHACASLSRWPTSHTGPGDRAGKRASEIVLFSEKYAAFQNKASNIYL